MEVEGLCQGCVEGVGEWDRADRIRIHTKLSVVLTG